jgi:hypothetical protein
VLSKALSFILGPFFDPLILSPIRNLQTNNQAVNRVLIFSTTLEPCFAGSNLCSSA